MSIVKLNAEQFAELNKVKGVVLEYAGKDGKNTAIQFFGKDYEATAKTQGEVLRVVKNVMLAHWLTKEKETELREKNDGIRTKLRATTPYRIHLYSATGEKIKIYDLSDSQWARIGLMPTKKDLERSARDKKKTVHDASVAMLEALNFRLELPKENTEDIDKEIKKLIEAIPVKEKKQVKEKEVVEAA